MILDQNGRVIPFGSGVFKVANQFLFLGILIDDRQSLRGESFLLLSDVGELLITVRAPGEGDLFAVHAKPEVHLFQQAAYRVLAYGDPQSGELLGDFAGCSPGSLDGRQWGRRPYRIANTPDTSSDYSLDGGFRLGFGVTTNSDTYFGHEFGKGYS